MKTSKGKGGSPSTFIMRNTVMAIGMVAAAVAVAAAGRESSQERMELTSADLQRVGEFLSELTHSLYANTASLCVLQEKGVNGSVSDYWRLAALLSRSFVFVVPCNTPPPTPRPCLTASRPPLAPASPTCRKNNRIDIYITDAEQEALVVDVQEIFGFRDSAMSLVGQPLGRWRHGVPLRLSNQPGLGPTDFQGQTIFLASFPYPPFLMRGKTCPESNHSDEITEHLPNHCLTQRPRHLMNDEVYIGFFMDIFNTLANKLNFTYRVVLPDHPDDWVFGTGRSDNYSGLVGMVALQKAEVALASLSMSQERQDDIDFSTNIDFFVRNLYIRANATESSLGWGTYAFAFEVPTWLGTLVLFLVTACIMWVVSRGEQDQTPREIYWFKDIAFMFFSCMVQQGVHATPISLRGRTVFIMFWMSCVVAYAYYTARLTSYLAVSTVKPPFRTFPEAVNSFPEWQIGIMKGTPLKTFIEDSTGKVYQQYSSILEDNPGLLVDSEEEGVARLLTENYAFFTDSPIMDYMFSENCSIRTLQINLFPSYGRLGYMKNLPFAGVLNKELTRLYDGGLLDRMRRQWWGQGLPCEEPSAFTELDFTHTVTAFVILLSGIICSLIFLIVERIQGKKIPRQPVVSESDLMTGMSEKAERKRGRKRKARRNTGDPPEYISFVDEGRDYSSP
ncbi:glutamate receptor ionotropic, kainate 4-like isoform X2 [Eriocheir sinensis]|uniref:glutamate receptor ionotropic, kainate 4-like isoform X2 n=1 Tax=Eriocheir sinensis TaxID=95602 RepID=UPI0021C7FCB8|nr:glutamate receptor ionotropic, kainate 4-like isoform X2 [Eriocheir sinensis]